LRIEPQSTLLPVHTDRHPHDNEGNPQLMEGAEMLAQQLNWERDVANGERRRSIKYLSQNDLRCGRLWWESRRVRR
jgi:hypothetical protein